jgi:hypothetical protein
MLAITMNSVLVGMWGTTGRPISLRRFGGKTSSEAATRRTVKKIALGEVVLVGRG